jgi:hypothetical protein
MVSSCEHGNEPSGYIKAREFIDQLNDCSLLMKDTALWSSLLNFLSKGRLSS